MREGTWRDAKKSTREVLNHNVALNRRNSEIKSYNRRFRTRRENRFFASALPVGCPRKLNPREIIVSLFPTIFHRERVIVAVVRSKDRVILAAAGSNYREGHVAALWRDLPCISNGSRMKFHPRKFAEQFGASRSAFNTRRPVFFPVAKQLARPASSPPAYPSLSFFVTKRRITIPSVPDSQKVSGAD